MSLRQNNGTFWICIEQYLASSLARWRSRHRLACRHRRRLHGRDQLLNTCTRGGCRLPAVGKPQLASELTSGGAEPADLRAAWRLQANAQSCCVAFCVAFTLLLLRPKMLPNDVNKRRFLGENFREFSFANSNNNKTIMTFRRLHSTQPACCPY